MMVVSYATLTEVIVAEVQITPMVVLRDSGIILMEGKSGVILKRIWANLETSSTETGMREQYV